MARTTCKARTKTGKPCSARPAAGQSLCFIHDPKQAAARAAARRKGGQFHRTPHGADLATIPNDINTLQDAKRILSYTLGEILPLDNSISRARVLIALFDSFVKALEIGEIETRLAALEARTK